MFSKVASSSHSPSVKQACITLYAIHPKTSQQTPKAAAGPLTIDKKKRNSSAPDPIVKLKLIKDTEHSRCIQQSATSPLPEKQYSTQASYPKPKQIDGSNQSPTHPTHPTPSATHGSSTAAVTTPILQW